MTDDQRGTMNWLRCQGWTPWAGRSTDKLWWCFGPKGEIYIGWWFGEQSCVHLPSLTVNNTCLLAPLAMFATTTTSLLGILLTSLTLVAPLPIPTSGGEPPALGIGPGTAIDHIPPLSVSWSVPWPVSHTTKGLMISVCGIWCGLTLSPLTISLTTPTSPISLPSLVPLEEVL